MEFVDSEDALGAVFVRAFGGVVEAGEFLAFGGGGGG